MENFICRLLPANFPSFPLLIVFHPSRSHDKNFRIEKCQILGKLSFVERLKSKLNSNPKCYLVTIDEGEEARMTITKRRSISLENYCFFLFALICQGKSYAIFFFSCKFITVDKSFSFPPLKEYFSPFFRF